MAMSLKPPCIRCKRTGRSDSWIVSASLNGIVLPDLNYPSVLNYSGCPVQTFAKHIDKMRSRVLQPFVEVFEVTIMVRCSHVKLTL